MDNPGRSRSIRQAQRSVFLAVTALVFALPMSMAGAETLTDALSLAYVNNPTLQARRAALRATDEQVPQALSGHRPTVTATIEAGKSNSSSRGAISHTKENRSPRAASLGFSQPIFRGLRTLHDTRRARATIKQARAQLVSTEQDVLFQTATTYMNVVRDQAVLRLNINNEQVLRRQLQATRDRFQVGEVTRTDVSQGVARLAQARATRVQAEGTLQISRAAYRRIVGRVPGKLGSPKKILRMPKTLKAAVSSATSGAPGLIAARYAEQAARHNVSLLAGAFWPTVSLDGSISRSVGVSSRATRSNSSSLTAKVTIPLYSAGLTSSRVRQAKHLVGQAHQQIIEARRAAVEAATQSWHNLQTARAQVRSFRTAVRANLIALDGVRQEAAAGLRTVLDVLDAEQELLDARVNLVRAERDQVVSAFEVWRAMGTLTASNLRLPVQFYDGLKNFQRVRYQPWGTGISTNWNTK